MRSTLEPLTKRITLDPLEAYLRDELIGVLKLFGVGYDIPSLEIRTYWSAMREARGVRNRFNILLSGETP